jgi:hypothetical protein
VAKCRAVPCPSCRTFALSAEVAAGSVAHFCARKGKNIQKRIIPFVQAFVRVPSLFHSFDTLQHDVWQKGLHTRAAGHCKVAEGEAGYDRLPSALLTSRRRQR